MIHRRAILVKFLPQIDISNHLNYALELQHCRQEFILQSWRNYVLCRKQGMAGVEGWAALGKQFSLLYDGVKEMTARDRIFKSHFKDMKSTLESLEPLFQQPAPYNNLLDQYRTEELEEFRLQMVQGVEDVRKCSNVHNWNRDKKHEYANKFVQLNESLQRLSNKLKVEVAKDVKASMVSIKNIETIFKMKGLSSAVPEPPSFIVGLAKPLEEVKMKLLNDKACSMLVLTAPGGCGKTTLATMFCHDKQVKDTFKDNIFFVTVSKQPNFVLIVEQLYQKTGSQAPTVHNDDIAVTLLQQFLQEEGKKPLLLVLDDVWPGSESILEKFDVISKIKERMPNYKILVTSRSIFPRFGSPYYLESLNDENAMQLFRHYSESSGDTSSNTILKTLSRKIVEQCKRTPLAIKTVGRSLCNQPVEMWKKRVIEWSKRSIFDSERELLLCFKSSLDALNTGLKECFIDLGSFPEDRKISVAALVDMWIELYDDLEDESLCLANIYELTTHNLASSRKVELEWEYYPDHFVTQHALLRELAIHQTKQQEQGPTERLIFDISEDKTPKWMREQRFPTMKARLVSISTDRMFSMKWNDDVNQPEAQVLVLNFEADKYVLPEFVKKMRTLKVLIVTNYGLPVELSNFQLLDSLSQLKRIRLERISVASIINNRFQLKSLRKISLYKCSIGQAFRNCPLLISEAFPNLEEMNIDFCNDLVEMPDELCALIHLKSLCITNCHKLSALPEEIGKLLNLEVLRLRSCTGLNKLPGSFKNLEKLILLDISGCTGIKELDFGEMSSLKKINMEQCSGLQIPPLSTTLEQVEEVICDEDKKALWETVLPSSKIRVLKQEGKLETDSEDSSSANVTP